MIHVYESQGYGCIELCVLTLNQCFVNLTKEPESTQSLWHSWRDGCIRQERRTDRFHSATGEREQRTEFKGQNCRPQKSTRQNIQTRIPTHSKLQA